MILSIINWGGANFTFLSIKAFMIFVGVYQSKEADSSFVIILSVECIYF